MGIGGLLAAKGIRCLPVRRDERGGCWIPPSQIVRVIHLMDRVQLAIALLPQDRELDLARFHAEFARNFAPVDEETARRWFADIQDGRLPPPDGSGGIEVFLDLPLVRLETLYWRERDPDRLLRITGEDFRRLLIGAWCGAISRAGNALAG